jgi:hypothetical protein
MKRIVNIAIILATIILLMLLGQRSTAQASRESCECRDLRSIRRLLEYRLGAVCDDRRCLPAPTPTAPNGGELP